jgi:molecular chaperone DnaK
MTQREPVIGIDLGTTNSVVASVVDGAPRVLPNRTGQLLTPSIVAVSRNGKRLVGHLAKRQAITNPENTVHAAKRLIGRRWGSREVGDAREILPYHLEPGPSGNDVRVRIGESLLSIPELSSFVLAELKADAEAVLERPVSRAVITVPAYFNDGQRQATKDAGRLAGLDVLRVVNEPTSAALAYGFGRKLDKKVAIFDLGGGTFDVSILDIGKGVYDVIAVGGDSYLGGEDFDRRIVDWLAKVFASENGGLDVRGDRMAHQRIRDAAEKAKCELSETNVASIHLPFLAGGGAGRPALHLEHQLTRAKLEELTGDLVERCIAAAMATLRDAGLRPSQIEEVILVGGMARMPLVQRAVRELFGREPSRTVHPEEVVALGAAIQAHALVHPDEEPGQPLLLDVTPQNLGIMVAGGYFQTIIARNTSVPTSETHVFTTSQDDQTAVRIAVLQGASENAFDNELLGEFVLANVRKAPRGEVEIEVNFEINAEGILSVSARDLATGRRQSIRVTATSGLAEEEIEALLGRRSSDDPQRKQDTSPDTARRREVIQGLLGEIEELLPTVRASLARTRYGQEALEKADAVVQRARAALEGREGSLTTAEEPLRRVLQLFRSLTGGGERTR